MAKKKAEPLEPVKVAVNPKSPWAVNGPSEEITPIYRNGNLAILTASDGVMGITHTATGIEIINERMIHSMSGRREYGPNGGRKIQAALKYFCEQWHKYIAEQPEGWLTDEMFTFGVMPTGETYDKLSQVARHMWPLMRSYVGA